MLIDAADRHVPDRWVDRAPAWLAHLAERISRIFIFGGGAAMSADDFSDRQLADLNVRRWELGPPDPREPRLF